MAELTALRVGVLGAGQAGARHARAYAQTDGVRLVSVADTNTGRAEQLARELSVQARRDEDELLADGLDAISICLPHALLHAAANQAIDHGCHILLEKPMALTLANACEIVDACQRRSLTLMVGFVHRFRPEPAAAWRAIQDGLIGRPAMALENFCSRGGPHPPAWVWDRSLAGGGVLIYGAIHGLDRLRWLLGSDICRVYGQAQAYSQDVAVEDGLVATLSFANGALATLMANSTRYEVTPRNWDTEVYGSEGMLRLRMGEYLEVSNNRTAYRQAFRQVDHFQLEVQEFAAAIRAGRAPAITGLDGIKALAATLAIYRSVADAVPVTVDDGLTSL